MKRLIVVGTLGTLFLAVAYLLINRNPKPKDFKTCVELGFPISETEPRECRAGTKTFTEDIPENEETPLEKEKNIKVTTPSADQKLTFPIVIKGEARVFENQLAYRITDETSAVLAQGTSTAKSPDIGQFGPFEITVTSIANPKTDKGSVSVFSYSPKNGREINKVTIPVIFLTDNTQIVKVFFGNTQNNSVDICQKTVAVERRIAKTPQVAREALTELLLGPTATEKQNGFFTNIKPLSKLNKITIVNGKATVDFSKEFNEGVAGSCTVTLIRQQVTDTLRQFPTIKEVIISVDGKTEEVLQP